MTQAIVTKYFGPTNSRGARIKATAWAGSLTVPYDYAADAELNHLLAARALAEKMGWRGGQWHEGGHPSGTGNIYVNSAAPAFTL